MSQDPDENSAQESNPYPLHKAVTYRRAEHLEHMLQQGHAPNQYGNDDIITALHVACIHSDIECAEILIKYGASVNTMTVGGQTPLWNACANGDVECVELLLANGADANPPLGLSTPLHEACLNGSEECVMMLIEAGARLDATDCQHGTPLHLATLINSPACVSRLLQAGASVDEVKIDQTALHMAAKNDFYEIGKILLEYGANVYASTSQNKLPIDLLPNFYGPFHDLLVEYSSQPRSLQDLCRKLIRAEVGPYRLHCLENMGLPPKAVQYLLHL